MFSLKKGKKLSVLYIYIYIQIKLQCSLTLFREVEKNTNLLEESIYLNIFDNPCGQVLRPIYSKKMSKRTTCLNSNHRKNASQMSIKDM